MIAWHLVRTTAGRSALVAESLRGMKLEGFTPLYETSVARGYSVSHRVRPLWPSWALARWDGDDAELWHRVHDTRFVAAIAGDALPTPVREAEVERWLGRCDERFVIPTEWLRANVADLLCPFVPHDDVTGTPGDYLRVTEGTLENLLGECIEVELGPFDVMVTIRAVILGVDKEVSLPYSQFTLAYRNLATGSKGTPGRRKRGKRGGREPRRVFGREPSLSR